MRVAANEKYRMGNRKMKIKPQIVALAAAVAGLAAVPAQAQLLINVTGTPGSGKTLWQFSGSSTYQHYITGGNTVILDDDGSPSWYWDLGTPDWMVANISNDDREFLSGSTASVKIGSRTELIGTLELDDQGVNDQFGLSNSSVANEWYMNDGDLIEWFGQGEIDVDITAFNTGTWNFSDYDQDGTLAMQMNIGSTGGVPEPGEWAAMGILGAGLAGLVIRKRRK